MVFLFEFCRKMFLQEKIGTRGFYLFQTVDLLFDIENQGFVHKCLAWRAGNREQERQKEGEKISLSFSLSTPPLPRRPLTSKS